jgi:transposase
MGYEGKRTTVYTNFGKYLPGRQKIVYLRELPMVYWRLRQVSLFLYRKPQELNSREKDLVSYLVKESPEVRKCFCLFQRFREMIEDKEGMGSIKWVEDAMDSSIKELRSFAQKILNDYSVVQNAICLPRSNEQVEEQIKKLKMIKRQMYGRAGFNLLRKRLVLENNLNLYH